MKPRLAISFSGGRSSAVMLKRCLDKYDATHDILICFANTGCEHEETLRFVDAVDRHFASGRVVWLEGVTNGPGVGPTARVVSYDTASRNGDPFRAAIEKHGVFSVTHPQCNSRLKTEPMLSYRRECGWEAGSYDTAIGIRADEVDRLSAKRAEHRLVYPLVKEGWRRRDVNEFMAQFEWDLNLPNDAFGNCVWCWKKSLRKLMTVAKADPAAFDFPAEMERLYGWKNNGTQAMTAPRTFFRGNRSSVDIVSQSQTEDFTPFADRKHEQMELFSFVSDIDIDGGCGDSCEAFTDYDSVEDHE